MGPVSVTHHWDGRRANHVRDASDAFFLSLRRRLANEGIQPVQWRKLENGVRAFLARQLITEKSALAQMDFHVQGILFSLPKLATISEFEFIRQERKRNGDEMGEPIKVSPKVWCTPSEAAATFHIPPDVTASLWSQMVQNWKQWRSEPEVICATPFDEANVNESFAYFAARAIQAMAPTKAQLGGAGGDNYRRAVLFSFLRHRFITWASLREPDFINGNVVRIRLRLEKTLGRILDDEVLASSLFLDGIGYSQQGELVHEPTEGDNTLESYYATLKTVHSTEQKARATRVQTPLRMVRSSMSKLRITKWKNEGQQSAKEAYDKFTKVRICLFHLNVLCLACWSSPVIRDSWSWPLILD